MNAAKVDLLTGKKKKILKQIHFSCSKSANNKNIWKSLQYLCFKTTHGALCVEKGSFWLEVGFALCCDHVVI